MVDFINYLGNLSTSISWKWMPIVAFIIVIILLSTFVKIKKICVENPLKKIYEGGCDQWIKIGNMYLPVLFWKRVRFNSNINISFPKEKITFEYASWNTKIKEKTFQDIHIVDVYWISKVIAVKFYNERYYLLIGIRERSVALELLNLLKDKKIQLSEKAENFLNENSANSWNKFLQEQDKKN